MPRSVCRLALAVGVLTSVARPVHAQATATYHLLNEVSATSGLRQLTIAGPDGARVAIPGVDLRNQMPGSRTIASFDTQTGVPNRGGVIASGSTVTFTIWMKKTAPAGTVFPQASLGLNFPVTTPLCQATGTTALTTTLHAFTISCKTTSPIVMNITDRLSVTAGYAMTVGPGNRNMKVRLDVEGRSTRAADSRVVAPNPVASAITSLTPNAGPVGTTFTVAGSNFGSTQGASTLTLDGVTAAPTGWTDTSITVKVPSGTATGLVIVTVGGVSSSGVSFTVIPTPSLSSLTPANGRANDAVTIAGANFGTTQGSSTVTFNGLAAALTNWTNISISAVVPVGATTGPLVVTVGGQASNPVTFTVAGGTGSGLLEITSPAGGSVVNPGQTLTVTVASPDNSTFSKIVVLGEGGLGVTDAGSTLPAQISLIVPAGIECRKYLLSAFGITTSGLDVSTAIEIDVERPDMPSSISSPMRQIIFEAAGESSSIDLVARFPDGSVLAVRESSNVTYASSDPGVVTVDATGVVTAIGEGEADVTATYGPPAGGVSVRIPVSVPPGVFTVSPSTLDFGPQAIGTTPSQQMTVTNSSSGPLGIVSLTATGDFAETDNCVASSPLAPGAFCTITVTFGPTVVGPRSGTIGIESSFHLVPVVLGLAGTGVGP